MTNHRARLTWLEGQLHTGPSSEWGTWLDAFTDNELWLMITEGTMYEGQPAPMGDDRPLPALLAGRDVKQLTDDELWQIMTSGSQYEGKPAPE